MRPYEYTNRAYWPWSVSSRTPIYVYCTRTQVHSLSSVLAWLSVLATLQMCWLQLCLDPASWMDLWSVLWVPSLLDGPLGCMLQLVTWVHLMHFACGAQDYLNHHLALPAAFWSYRAVFLTEGTAYPVVTLMSWLSFPEGAVGPWCFQAKAVFRNFDSEMRSCKKSFSKKAGKKENWWTFPYFSLFQFI